MMPRTLTALACFVFSTIGSAHAEKMPIDSGFEFEALQKKSDQMSCRHLMLRTGQTFTNLDTFASVQKELSQASIQGELSSFIRQRNGYPVDLLLREPVYRVRYPVQDPGLAATLNRAQTTAVWGVGFFEPQNPNGGFTQTHYQVTHTNAGLPEIEFDVRAADVCVGQRYEVILFSGCPLEIIRFETDEGPWESPAFVTQWWKCQNSTTLSFDLSRLAQDLGNRKP
jgi:hypothetical protein